MNSAARRFKAMKNDSFPAEIKIGRTYVTWPDTATRSPMPRKRVLFFRQVRADGTAPQTQMQGSASLPDRAKKGIGAPSCVNEQRARLDAPAHEQPKGISKEGSGGGRASQNTNTNGYEASPRWPSATQPPEAERLLKSWSIRLTKL
jgi:hypothetical protein